MLRKLVTWLLLAPMLVNGLWMVCSDASSETVTAATAQSEESADCMKMCAMKYAKELGSICFVLPGDSQTSITIHDFGAAILPLEFRLQPFAVEEQFVTNVAHFYSNPSLYSHTPPPKA
jgi:hypothetical protein